MKTPHWTDEEWDEFWDADLVCAVMSNAGLTQADIDAQAPFDCGRHWLSDAEYRRRIYPGQESGEGD